MDREKDYANFLIFMISLAEGTPQRGTITEDTLEIYFQLIEDIDFEIVKKNAINAVRRKGFFPLIPDIRNESEIEFQAQNDVELVEKLCKEFIFPEFPEAGTNAVILILEKLEKSHLLSMVDRFGAEIVNGLNPSATRAQMLKVHRTEIERQNLLTTGINMDTQKILKGKVGS